MHQSSHNVLSLSDLFLLNAQEIEYHCCEKDSYAFLMSIVDYSNSDDILLGEEEATQILQQYLDPAEVFFKDSAREFSEHGSHNSLIETIGDPPFVLLYNLSQTDLEVLLDYIEDNLARRSIELFSLSAGDPISFVKKKVGSLCLCVDYRRLNLVISKNCYPLLLISETLDRVVRA